MLFAGGEMERTRCWEEDLRCGDPEKKMELVVWELC